MRQIHRLLMAFAASMAASACSPEASAPAPEQNREAETRAPVPVDAANEAEPQRNEATPAEPKKIAASGRRCGWLHNPTPANWWLVDKDGQWVLGSQGAEQVAGMDEMPDMSSGEWVEVNGSYGYGCACMDMVVDPKSGDVLRISGAAPKPLAQCRNDRSLPNPDEG